MWPLSVIELLCRPDCIIGPEYVLCFCLTWLLQFFPSGDVEGNESISDPGFLGLSALLSLWAPPSLEDNASLVSGPFWPCSAEVLSLKYNRRLNELPILKHETHTATVMCQEVHRSLRTNKLGFNIINMDHEKTEKDWNTTLTTKTKGRKNVIDITHLQLFPFNCVGFPKWLSEDVSWQ